MTWPPLAPLLSRLRARDGYTDTSRLAETMLSPHFAAGEMACRDGTPLPARYLENARRLCAELEYLRAELGRPIVILSGYRTPEHNARVKGAQHSRHLVGEAADIVVHGVTPAAVADTIERLIVGRRMRDGGLGRYPTFTHYDVRFGRARWRKP